MAGLSSHRARRRRSGIGVRLAERHFTVFRIRGGGDLWVSEVVITYDRVPSYAVSVMEFTGDLVAAGDIPNGLQALR